MSPEEKNEDSALPEGDDGAKRVLLNAEEWTEPPGRKILSEYHKDGLPDGLVDTKAADKSDLESFAGYWNTNAAKQVRSEYHKEGAPYMEAPSEWDGHRPRSGRPSNKVSEKMAHDSRVLARGAGNGAGSDAEGKGPQVGAGAHAAVQGPRYGARGDEMVQGPRDDAASDAEGKGPHHGAGGHAGGKRAGGKEIPSSGEGGLQPESDVQPESLWSTGALVKQPLIQRVLDVSTIEVLTFAMFRAIFGRGIRIPLKLEDVIDMEIVAKDKDIVLNTNQLYFQVPELSVWRFIFAYKGKPVIEYGRGIKNQIRIHYYRMFVVLLSTWWGSWKRKRAHKKKAEANAEAEAMYASKGSRMKKEGGAGKK